jgi:hypothetical protein
MRLNNVTNKDLLDSQQHTRRYSSKATNGILDNTPLTMIYEELVPEAVDAGRQSPIFLKQCQIEGGLFESQVKWIKAVHLIHHPSHAQLVQARAFFPPTWHYSMISQEQLNNEFQEHTATRNVPVVHYVRHNTY